MKEHVYIGFSMHPKWLTGTTLEAFLQPLQQYGLNSFEFELDSDQPDWNEFEPLMEQCAQSGIQICFHAPYRARYSLDGFSRDHREEIISVNLPLWSLAEKWAKRATCRTEIVVHGAKSKVSTRQELYADTKSFLIWALETFPHLTIALENLDLAKPGEIKIGDNRPEVLALVQEIDHPRLGICWDLGHDTRHGIETTPSEEWLQNVVHAHVHDVNKEGADHFPLIFGNVPVQRWLEGLKAYGECGTISLELKGNHLVGWAPTEITNALSSSIHKIKEVFS